MAYEEDAFLPLSGIQHFVFCRRQWALIQIEQQWADNLRTVEGDILHERAHNDYRAEKRGGLILSRAMPVFSRELGVRGVCDVVELHCCDDGVSIHGREGTYRPLPVEYKRGSPKETPADVLQLAAQAMCLEEMFVCPVTEGYLYYGETARRLPVHIDEALREQVRAMCHEMHAYYERRYTPKVKTGSFCRACSLSSLCLPKLCKERSARRYMAARVAEDEEEPTPGKGEDR